MTRSPDAPAVVFDCMIFLQAIANEESPAARAFDLVESGEVTLCVSAQILRELRSVLNRSEVRTALPGIDDLRIEQAALGVGMKEKAEEFVAAGAEIYQDMARQD